MSLKSTPRKTRKHRRERRMLFEHLERRELLAADWRNPADWLDVNANRVVSAADALAVINTINASGSRPLDQPRPTDSFAPFYDVTGDGNVFPDDVLVVINAINAENASPFHLMESSSIVSDSYTVIGLGQDAGARTYRFEIEANFDRSDTSASVEDVFVAYLVDNSDIQNTLLDRGINGTSIFALAGDQVDFVPGLVRFDGNIVEVDLTSLGEMQEARLVFQLLNSDGDSDSEVIVRPIDNELNPDALQSPAFTDSSVRRGAGGGLNFNDLTLTTDLVPLLSNIRYDKSRGEYRADLRVRNDGDSTGRMVAVELTGLPDDVVLRNATGTTPSGNPYISFREAIPFGGLDRGAISDPIEVVLDIANQARFSWTLELYTGQANRAPDFDPIAPVTPITVIVGAPVELEFSATDPDGDPVMFTIAPAAEMPNMMFDGSGAMRINAAPDQVGSYEFSAFATDGQLRTEQVVQLEVIADTNRATRISGVVQDVNESPLADVPISLGGVATLTDQHGRFVVELPPYRFPTDAFAIEIPIGDPFFDPQATGEESMPFRRAVYDHATGDSVDNPLQHPNLITSFIDASAVYGSDDERADALRRNDGTGRLKIQPTLNGDLLPRK